MADVLRLNEGKNQKKDKLTKDVQAKSGSGFFTNMFNGFGKKISSSEENEIFETALVKLSFLVNKSIETKMESDEELKKIILQINEESEKVICDLKNQLLHEKKKNIKSLEEKKLITEDYLELKKNEEMFNELKQTLETSNKLLEKENTKLKLICREEISEIEKIMNGD